MSDGRRYDRDEIERIFERAMRPEDEPTHAGASGLTLPELKEIAREVGIPPERVEAAALELAREQSVPATTSGDAGGIAGGPSRLDRILASGPLPVAVHHDAPLPRAPTDAEWETMVTELRETFRARGHVRAYGNLREWSNGNLSILLEPAPGGHRVRMSTRKGSAQSLGGIGLAMIAGGLLLGPTAGWGDATALIVGGAGLFGAGAWPLPGWSRRRRLQMRALAEQWRERLAAPPTG